MTRNLLAIDWDNTCTDETFIKYPYEAPIRKDCKKYLKKLVDLGYETILWTTREEKFKFQVIERIFKEDLAFTTVFKNNKEMIKFHITTHFKYLAKDRTKICKEYFYNRDKIIANYFIDDKNIFMKEINWKTIFKYLKQEVLNDTDKHLSK